MPIATADLRPRRRAGLPPDHPQGEVPVEDLQRSEGILVDRAVCRAAEGHVVDAVCIPPVPSRRVCAADPRRRHARIRAERRERRIAIKEQRLRHARVSQAAAVAQHERPLRRSLRQRQLLAQPAELRLSQAAAPRVEAARGALDARERVREGEQVCAGRRSNRDGRDGLRQQAHRLRVRRAARLVPEKRDGGRVENEDAPAGDGRKGVVGGGGRRRPERRDRAHSLRPEREQVAAAAGDVELRPLATGDHLSVGGERAGKGASGLGREDIAQVRDERDGRHQARRVPELHAPLEHLEAVPRSTGWRVLRVRVLRACDEAGGEERLRRLDVERDEAAVGV
mmetsp:Transcript_32834/g.104600  ORF Transcript_32834/g.104600 Transcript_32834/m.104600 type:complete len:340 (-) Transcript_32834:35-1054(-)